METPVLTELKGPILLDHILLDIYNIYLKVFTNYLLSTSVPLRKIFFSASLLAFVVSLLNMSSLQMRLNSCKSELSHSLLYLL